MSTALIWHEQFMWLQAGSGAGLMLHGPNIQPGRYNETPETKRRIRNMLEVSGLLKELVQLEPRPATDAELHSVHTAEYIRRIKELSDASGGDAGMQAPFGKGDYEIACLAAGGAITAVDAVMNGRVDNAYALLRPIGHHATADYGMGYCIFNNGAIAGLHALNISGITRIAYVDWDVHHGNGTQSIFYEDPRALTISIHQENWLPPDSGHVSERGAGPGEGYNLNIPLPPGSGAGAYQAALERLVIPVLRDFKPDLIFVGCGFDAGVMDPLGAMLLHSEAFRSLTKSMLLIADEVCEGRLIFNQEGGYCEATSPFYGLAVIETLSGIKTNVVDPYLELVQSMGGQQLQPHQDQLISEIEAMRTPL
jgi:acetoin utilization deacetylase AcuC-like enzyme